MGSSSAFRIAGDITVECLIRFGATNSNPIAVCGCRNDGEGESANSLWQLYLVNGTYEFGWFSEHSSSATNDNYQVPGGPAPWIVAHLAATRASNVITFYLNGRIIGSASSTISTPTGGTNSNLWVGGDNETPASRFAVSSLKIIGSALNATQIKAEFNRCLGAFYGIAA